MTDGQIARIASDAAQELILVFNRKVSHQRVYPALLLIYTLRQIAKNEQVAYHLATLTDAILSAAGQNNSYCYDSICKTIFYGR